MSTLTSDMLTLADLAARYNNNNILAVAEVLAKQNLILNDIPFSQANGIYGHVISRRTSLPSGSWRQLNKGVARERSHTQPDQEAIGSLEAFSMVDKDLVQGAPDPVQFRTLEDMAFVEGLRQTFATALMYANPAVNPEKFKGLAPRIASLSSTSKDGESNVIGASGTGSDLTSIWIVQWGRGKAYMVYPRGSQAGLSMQDLGLQVVQDASSNDYLAYKTHFEWKSGLVVEDDRCIQRIANIETSGSSNIFDAHDLITALNRLPDGGRGAVIYCNKTIKTQMDIAAEAKTNVSYTSSELFGVPVLNFRGVPVRQVDAILDTETALA